METISGQNSKTTRNRRGKNGFARGGKGYFHIGRDNKIPSTQENFLYGSLATLGGLVIGFLTYLNLVLPLIK